MVKLELFVKIKSDKYLTIWQKTIEDNPEINIKLIDNKHFIDCCLKSSNQTQIIICEESVIFGKKSFERIEELITQLNHSIANWGLVSNIGMLINDDIINYSKNSNGLYPIKSAYPKPAIIASGNVLLLNKENLRKSNIEFKDPENIKNLAITLSLKMLEKGLLPVIDHNLMVYDYASYNKKDLAKFINKHFIDKQTIKSLYDKALLISYHNKKPQLTIICRTQLNRANLLTRAIKSFATSHENSENLIDLKVMIVTDQDEKLLYSEVERLKKMAPNLAIEGKKITPSPNRYSRTNLIITTMESIESDYAWFVDDDDYITDNAVLEIGRNLSISGKTLLIGCCYGQYEQWDDNAIIPSKSTTIRIYDSNNIYNLYRGENFIPICGCVFPIRQLKQQIANLSLSGDYYEDYALIMLALGSNESELSIIKSFIANISIRKQGNSITEQDRTHWNYSYISFFNEIISSNNSGSVIMWQLASKIITNHLIKVIKNPTILLCRIRQIIYNIKNFGLRDTIKKIIRFITRN